MIRHCDTRKRGGGNLHHLPDHLLIELILPRLPLPCLFRCTAVCKAWRLLVHNAHALYGGTMTNHALAILGVAPNLPRYTPIIRVITPSQASPDDGGAPIDIGRQFFPGWGYSDATNGFLLYKSQCNSRRGFCYTLGLHVCNPLTLKSASLPPTHFDSTHAAYLFSMLAFDPALFHHYKVVSFCGSGHTENGQRLFQKVSVFSSHQAHLGWRELEEQLQAPPNEVSQSIDRTNTVCLNGFAYRLGFKTGTHLCHAFKSVVLSFHFDDERIELFDAPLASDLLAWTGWDGLDKVGGCLHYLCNDATDISIWRLQEDGRSWAFRRLIRFNNVPGYNYQLNRNWGTCALAVHSNEEVFYFIGEKELLYQCYIKQNKINCYNDSDGRLVPGRRETLLPFLCCAIDPDFPSELHDSKTIGEACK